MIVVLKQIKESFWFAWNALRSNILRTVLSLLGVTIGIFAIISVLTIVDSLERNIRDSLDFLGSDIIYVTKWEFLPDADGVYKWWEFMRRPNPSYYEYQILEENLRYAGAISIFADRGGHTLKNGSNSIENITLTGASYTYKDTKDLKIEKGRYFTPTETSAGRNVAIIGSKIAEGLFPGNPNPIGETMKVKNIKFVVIGVLEFEGESFLGTPSTDEICIIPYGAFRKLYLTGTGAIKELGSNISIKGYPTDIGLIELENEITGLMRNLRGLKPKEKNNFALNRPEAIGKVLDGLFNVLNIAGWVIGGFSILIGGFGIANIMFVSVKERTSIIGLQKSLGAKNYFILFQFLFEAIFLSLIGGSAGLLLVYLITLIPMGNLEVTMSFANILIGLGVSSAIGTLSGIIPSARAANMDPVIALRS
jgi:putative ABC transport system permease protein